MVFTPTAGVATVTAASVPMVVTSSTQIATGMKKELAVQSDLKNIKVPATYITAAGFVGGTGTISLTS